jgi:uncharacterized RDD family membrane protein YckC
MTSMAVTLGRLEVETADHVVLRYDLAGGGNRGFAALVDFVVASLVFFAALWAFGEIADRIGNEIVGPYFGVLVLLVFLIAWSYFVLVEWLWNGQTIGKRIYGLRVIGEDGAPAGFVAVLVRNLLRMVDFLPAFYGVGLLAIILSSKSQRLGDLAAGTYVVRAPRPKVDWLALRTVTAVGPGKRVEVRGLPGEAQRLVREFAAREAKLRPADRARVAHQIAERIRPYALDVAPEADDVELLRAVARSLRASGGE